MIYTSFLEYKDISVNDQVRVRGRFIPPCSQEVHPIGEKFLKYMKKEDNLFTITDIKVLGVAVFVSVFEVSEYLYYEQILIPKYNVKIKILNWSDRWEQKLLNLKTAAE